MGLSMYVNKIKAFMRGQKGQRLMDKAQDAGSKATGGRHDEKIRKARGAAQKAIRSDDDPDDHSLGGRRP